MLSANALPANEDHSLPGDAVQLCVLDDLTVTSDTRNLQRAGADLPFEASTGKQLLLKDHKARSRLATAIARLKQSPSCGSAFVQLGDGERNRSRYLVVSRRPNLERSPGRLPERVQFVIALRDLAGLVELSAESLEQSLDLTPMVARLCIALLNEHSLQEFADDSGLAIATARWHWGNVREKLHVRTQVGLVRMLLRLAPH